MDSRARRVCAAKVRSHSDLADSIFCYHFNERQTPQNARRAFRPADACRSGFRRYRIAMLSAPSASRQGSPALSGGRARLMVRRIGSHAMTDTLLYKGYRARGEFDARDNIFVGQVLGLADRITFHGTTVDKLIADFHAGVDHYLKDCAKTGRDPQKPASGKLMPRMPRERASISGWTRYWSGRRLNGGRVQSSQPTTPHKPHRRAVTRRLVQAAFRGHRRAAPYLARQASPAEPPPAAARARSGGFPHRADGKTARRRPGIRSREFLMKSARFFRHITPAKQACRKSRQRPR